MLGMLLMSAADGVLDPEELVSLESFFITVPDFRGKDFGHVLEETAKLHRKSGSIGEAVQLLGGLSTDTLKQKCFLLSADIAMSSGDVDEAEDELLEVMQRVLGISDELATQILQVLQIKYAEA